MINWLKSAFGLMMIALPIFACDVDSYYKIALNTPQEVAVSAAEKNYWTIDTQEGLVYDVTVTILDPIPPITSEGPYANIIFYYVIGEIALSCKDCLFEQEVPIAQTYQFEFQATTDKARIWTRWPVSIKRIQVYVTELAP